MNNLCNAELCTFFSSNATTILKDIVIPECEFFVNDEIDINCCPICKCNRRHCRHVTRNSPNCTSNNCRCENTEQPISSHDFQSGTNEHSIAIDPCTPFLEETIPLEVNDGKLLQIQLHLMNICPNRPLAIGILLCCNEQPYALKVKKVCKRIPCCKSCKHHSCCCCKCCNNHSCNCNTLCTSTCFEFLLTCCPPHNKVTLKIITEYLC